jgi:hypothetical protein
LAGILVAFPLPAQEAPIRIVLGAYYRCDQAREARADTIIRQTFAPLLDRQVEAGRLTGWAWLSHRMGTDWRRLLVTTGTDRDAMLDARGEMIEELGQRHVTAVQELGAICPSHDDYMWTTVVNNAGSGQAAAMSLAMYFVCEIPRQELADDLFRQFVAPIFDRHVERGTIRGYAWLAHRMGGKVRRLLTMGAADTKSLLNAQDAIYEDVEREPSASRAQAEIDVICGPHDDYIWNQTIVRP